MAAKGFDGWLPGSPESFVLQPGHGYFVKVSAPTSNNLLSISGLPSGQSVPLDLVAGFNLFSVPFASLPEGYDAQTLTDLIEASGGAVDSIQRWGVGGSQGFDGWLPGSPVPFAIDPKSGYFLKLSQAPTAQVSL